MPMKRRLLGKHKGRFGLTGTYPSVMDTGVGEVYRSRESRGASRAYLEGGKLVAECAVSH